MKMTLAQMKGDIRKPARLPAIADGASLQEIAVAFCEEGFWIGVTGLGKHAGWLMGTGWPNKTTQDPEVAAGWFSGIGMEDWNPSRRGEEITGIFLHCAERFGYCASDLDNMDAAQRDGVLEVLERYGSGRQYTREDGSRFHTVFLCSGRVENANREFGEIRAQNEIIMLHGSRHPKEGGKYWIDPERRELVEYPAELEIAVKRARGKEGAGGGAAWSFKKLKNDIGVRIEIGAREQTMFSYACKLRWFGVAWDEAARLILARLEDCDNSDGRATEKFALKKLENAWKKDTAEARREAEEADREDQEKWFWGSRKMLTHIQKGARYDMVSPWPAFAWAAVRCVSCISPSVVLPPTITGGIGTMNLCVGIVAPPSSGKDGARSSSRAHVTMSAEPYETKPATGQAIAALFIVRKKRGDEWEDVVIRRAAILNASEVDTITAHADDARSVFFPELRDGWSGHTLGFSYKTQEARVIVPEHSYRLCSVVSVQPGASRGLINKRQIEAGTVARFTFFDAASDSGMATRLEDLEHPGDPINWEPPQHAPGGLGMMHRIMDVDDEIVREIRQARMDERLGVASFPEHYYYNKYKWSAALAAMDGRLSISLEDWELAEVVMQHSLATLKECKRYLASDTATENAKKAAAAGEREAIVEDIKENSRVAKLSVPILRKISSEWISRAELTRMASRSARELMDEILEYLEKAGKIESESTGSHNPGFRYRLSH